MSAVIFLYILQINKLWRLFLSYYHDLSYYCQWNIYPLISGTISWHTLPTFNQSHTPQRPADYPLTIWSIQKSVFHTRIKKQKKKKKKRCQSHYGIGFSLRKICSGFPNDDVVDISSRLQSENQMIDIIT